MKIAKQLEGLAKAIAFAPVIILQHGSLRPERVRIKETGGYIYIDPKDRRAIKKLVLDTVRRRVSEPMRFWRDFLAKLKPDFALDIGVNYGECLFSVRYPGVTRVIGCEANLGIIPCITRSRDSHPDAGHIEVIHGLISDTSDQQQNFYVDPTWSGTASVVAPDHHDSPTVRVCEMTTRRLDSILTPQEAAGRVILFKMDIEGSEPRAMGGFETSLNQARLVVGFMEYDTTFIRNAGSDPVAFFEKTARQFSVFILKDAAPLTLIRVKEFSSLPKSRAKDGRVHTDLILVTQGVAASEWLPEGWTVE